MWFDQPNQRASQCGLARPGFANDAQCLPRTHGETGPFDGNEPARAARQHIAERTSAITYLDAFCLDQRRTSGSLVHLAQFQPVRVRRDQHLCIFMFRCINHARNRAAFHQLGTAHHQKIIADPRNSTQIVADENHRQTVVAPQLRQQIQHAFLHRRIQCRRRFIRQQQVRLTRQRTGDHRALFHATRQLVRIGPRPARGLGNTDHVQQTQHLVAHFSTSELRMFDQCFCDLVPNPHQRVEMGGRALKDHRDTFAAQGIQRGL